MNFNTNHIFRAFNGQIDKTKTWIQVRVQSTCGYSRDLIVNRLMQRLIEIGLRPYSNAVSVQGDEAGGGIPRDGALLDCGKVFLEMGSGRIVVTPKQWLLNQFDYLIHWVYGLVAIFNATVNYASKLPAAVVLGIGEESIFIDGSDAKFVAFCRKGPIEPLRISRRLHIQYISKHGSSSDAAFDYCKRPLIRLLRGSILGISGRLRLLKKHLKNCFAYFWVSIRVPSLTLLARDFAYSGIAIELDRRGLIESVVLTSAHHLAQPLWTRVLRNAKVHMVWYTQAAKQFVYTAAPLDCPTPSYRWIKVDTHWVWTRCFADYLRMHCPDAAIEVVGPIVWCMPELKQPGKDVIDIIIFDISPYSDTRALTFGEIPNYNHPKNVSLFTHDLIRLKTKLEAQFRMPVVLSLKTRRGYKAAYDRSYFEHLESLRSEGVLTIKHHATNLYSLISGSHLVIAYPFTSPPYIAEWLQVPSIYYDPTATLVRQHFGDSPSLVDFANTPDSLFAAASSAINSRLTKLIGSAKL